MHNHPNVKFSCRGIYIYIYIYIYTQHTYTIWLPKKAHNCHILGAILNRPSLCSASHFRPAKPVTWTQKVNYCIFKCQISCPAHLDYRLVTEQWRKGQWNIKLNSVIIFLISVYTKVASWLDMLHRELKTMFHLIKQLIFIWTESELI